MADVHQRADRYNRDSQHPSPETAPARGNGSRLTLLSVSQFSPGIMVEDPDGRPGGRRRNHSLQQ